MKHIFILICLFAVSRFFSAQAQTITSKTFNYSGQIETWTVPDGVSSLTIEARGAEGGVNSGGTVTGKGALIIGTLPVTAGAKLKILVGQHPTIGRFVYVGGGGGGSFVTDISNNPLIIAGGGGGSGYTVDFSGRQGQAGTNGGDGNAIDGFLGGTGGSNGAGGSATGGSGGGGLLSDGADGRYGGGGKAFIHGGAGGISSNSNPGGFGGGAAGDAYDPGGGGGYSGGGSGDSFGAGGGGGSYNIGSNQTNTAGVNVGHGKVTISYITDCTAFKSTLSSSGSLSDTNQTVTITATGGGTYVFSQGAAQQGGSTGNTATVTAPGTYSVSVTRSDNGCTATASTTVTGAANPPASCRNGTAVISVVASGNPVKYEWYRNSTSTVRLMDIPNFQRGTNTASLTLINQQTTANYYVRVVDQNGSSVVYGPIKVTVNTACNARLGVEEVSLQITVLGNPLPGEQLRATVQGAAGKALNVQLLDLSGKPIRQQVWQQAESNQVIDWNLSGQASGVYLLQATTPTGRQSVKVIKP